MRRTWQFLPVLLLAVLAAATVQGTVAGPPKAQASETTYRYWSFWKLDGQDWTYQQEGPGTRVPEDGTVEGWRFALSAERGAAGSTYTPRDTSRFTTICADTAPRSGRKRVGVVVDPGTARDAPHGAHPHKPRTHCVRAPKNATSTQLLAQVEKPLRYDGSGLLCAVAGYPKTGCGQPVDRGDTASADAAPHKQKDEAADSDDDGAWGGTVGLVAGGVLLGALLVGAVVQVRRRGRGA